MKWFKWPYEIISMSRVMNQEITEDISNAVIRITTWIEHTTIGTLFMDVPQKNKISYVTHVWRHAKKSVYFAYLAICFWIHAFFPFLCSSVPFTVTPLTVEKKELPNKVESVLKPEKENLGNGTTV